MKNSRMDNQNHQRNALNVVLCATAIVLSLISFIVCWQGASQEPYFSFDQYQAFVQVGVATALIALWIAWAVGLIVAAQAGKIRPLWYFALVWVVLWIFYLAACPSGYLDDMQGLFLGFPNE